MAVNLKPIPFEPLQDFVLIKPIEQGMTAGGIAVPEGVSQHDARKGKVVKVGPGRVTENGEFISSNVAEGQTVYLFFAYSQPIEITLNGEKYIIARCRDLIGLAA